MKIKKEDVPVVMEGPDTIMRNLPGYGGMTVGYNEVPAGTDLGPLLKGLKNDSCHCAHWGYMVQGSMWVKYVDGTEETISAGDVFYMPAGHTGIVKKDIKILDFSPSKEFEDVMNAYREKDGGDAGMIKSNAQVCVLTYLQTKPCLLFSDSCPTNHGG